MGQLHIVHLSDHHLEDIHQKTTPEDGHAVADTVFDEESPANTLICDTGDFTGSGLAIQYRSAHRLIARYRRRGFDYIICPANHDFGPAGAMVADYAVQNFHRLASAAFPGHDPEAPYPHLHRRDDLAVIVTNSCAEQTLIARGKLGKPQLKRLDALLEQLRGQQLKTCLMIHHCPTLEHRAYRLVDRDKLTTVLNRHGGVDLMLAGHLHRHETHHNRFGARLLLGSPVVTLQRRYRRIWFDGDHIHTRWIYLDGQHHRQ